MSINFTFKINSVAPHVELKIRLFMKLETRKWSSNGFKKNMLSLKIMTKKFIYTLKNRISRLMHSHF